jgi:hypothetical protein
MVPDTPTIANEYAPAAKLVYEYVVPVIPATFPAAADVILYVLPDVGLAVQFREMVAPSVVAVKFVGGCVSIESWTLHVVLATPA